MTLFYDQLLREPHIDDELKTLLKKCFVVDATHVSDYYYEGTEQEIWKIGEDFPNVAPPFDMFFLDFQAPSQIVSKVYGTKDWNKHAPLRWGVLCASIGTEENMAYLHTSEGRMEITQSIEAKLASMQKTLKPLIQQMERLANEGISQEDFDLWFESLSPLKQKNLQHYYSGVETLDKMKQQKWDELEKDIQRTANGAKWSLECLVFAHFRDSQWQQQKGPFWKMTIYVDADGRIIKDASGEVEPFYAALGLVEEKARIVQEEYGQEAMMKFFENARDTFMPFLHTSLLAISFMHCKNVSLEQIKPCRPKPLTRSQIKRGVKAIPPVTYHILNIEPMKQILRTEGQSEKVGIQRSLHICRGHFSHYGPDKKLFGKYEGTFWIPQHVRGNQKVGIALKDYRIKV